MALSSRFHAVLLTIGFSLLILGPLIYRLSQFSQPVEWAVGGGGALLYVLWQVKESRISVREIDRQEADHDRGTMPLASLAKNVLLFSALLVGGQQRWDFGVAAAVIFLSGVSLRTLGVSKLGEHYSHRIRRPEALVTEGIYGWLRHPAYAGTLLAHAAIPLAFPNPYTLGAYLLAWVPVVILRTVVEDRFLHAELGEEYSLYAARTKRLIPGVW
ncbi:MAG: isoprenylcysteine carboxylmethyltransferase family protein [Planctomycetes bacterium]|nr:isoprenylcysteine carboxylmethyltransferase family protein [Planctomycetota bacterium]